MKFKPTITNRADGSQIEGELKATLMGGMYNGEKRFSSDLRLCMPIKDNPSLLTNYADYLRTKVALYVSSGDKEVNNDGSENFYFEGIYSILEILGGKVGG